MANMNPELRYNLDGSFDMRYRKNRIWLDDLQRGCSQRFQGEIKAMMVQMTKYENLVVKQGAIIGKLSDENPIEKVSDACDCVICLEPMQGLVTLHCGHILCPNCFAKHSRVNNTCPFCRQEFSCKPAKPPEPMPDFIVESLVDRWATLTGPDYFYNQLASNQSKQSDVDKMNHLRWLVCANAKLIIQNRVRPWYETEPQISNI